MIVELSDEAQGDLEHIADYIARDNPRRALSFVQELRDKCEALAYSALGFPLVPRYERHEIRRRVHGRYLIFYRADTDRVVVLRILHGAMDHVAILFED
jgi:plasmid stabilization system protein ParE